MPDRVTALEHNFSAWLRTASLEEITALLDILGRELVVARLMTERLPGRAEEAGHYALKAAGLLKGVTEITITNLTDQPNRVELSTRPRSSPPL